MVNGKFIKSLVKTSQAVLLVLFVGIVLAATIRGYSGNPTSVEINSTKWKEAGPLELSPERGRYALLYSIVEDKSFKFNLEIARFATPDVAFSNGQYVSLFAPLVSFAAIPGYFLGSLLGIAQVGAFATTALFALFNVLLIRSIALKLGANNAVSTASSLIFLFATPAFAYAVTLYQHHISTFLILSVLLLILKYNNWISLFLIWLLFAASIPVDYPNLILMLPLVIFATTRIIWLKKDESFVKVFFKPLYALSMLSMLVPLLFYVWFSQNSYDKPLQLAGTLKAVQAIDKHGLPTDSSLLEGNAKTAEIEILPEKKKDAVGFFLTRNLLNGFYLHFFSPDRGIVFFAPIVMFGILGTYYLWRKRQSILAVMTGVVGLNIILYSMWGDPWGGWAFGSRYLIPTYAILSIFIALALSNFRQKLVLMPVFLIAMVYSISVSTLGAVTTNTNPPQVEILALEKQTNRLERYSYDRNWEYLNSQGSKSYMFNEHLNSYLTPQQFYWLIVITISSLLVILSLYGVLRKK